MMAVSCCTCFIKPPFKLYLILEQRALLAIRSDAKMLICQLGCNTSPRSPVQKTNLDQERLIYFLDGVGFLRQRRRQRVHSHRAALIFLDNSQEELAIHFIEAVTIHFEHLQ